LVENLPLGVGFLNTLWSSIREVLKKEILKGKVLNKRHLFESLDVNLIDEDVKINKGTNGRFSKQAAMS